MNKTTSSPIRIAILTRMFPNIVQTYVLNHILSLNNFGAETLIIAEKDPKQKEIHPRVIENNLLDKTIYISTEFNKIFWQLLTLPITRPAYWSALRRIFFSNIWRQYGLKYGLKSLVRAKILSKHSFNIVHSHSLFSSYDYLFLKEIFSIPITTTFHGLVPKNVKMLSTNKIKPALDACDVFFVNTVFARNQLVDLGCDLGKIHIIPQGTNTLDFPFKSRKICNDAPINILSVGRLSIEKGFHISIRAIATIIKNHPNIKYRIVGGGIEENNLAELIKDLGLQNNVEIIGSVSTEMLSSYYADAHIFILPSIDFRDGSHTETQGVVLQEAQSSGIPVIASKTGGIPEIINDNVTGLLFDEENHEQLSKKISSLIDNDQIYQSLSIQGKKDVEDNYSIDVICNQLINVYQNTIKASDG